ncbi:MAG TPA: prenyltransferase/squalene oxidase repeat-containing protein [Verrucomicrobiae bacterium]|nr:prenyltransferase/squalene oxidase repeat-containing protein [Verrucomicrobiae bacterium]
MEGTLSWRGRARGVFLHLFTAGALALWIAVGAQGQELFQGGGDVSPSQVERVYVRGLQYLVKAQLPEGRWNEMPYGAEPAVVGLAVISMLAHGDDPNSGPYAAALKRGLDYILKQLNPTTGYIGRSMYNHGFSTLALAEAYGQVEDERLGPALEKAVRLILSSQGRNPFLAWRYSPESVDADTTVSGAQMVALFAARNSGIAVPEDAIQKGIAFFLKCQTPEGGFGYTSASSPNGARTAIGCLVLALAKEKQSKAFQNAFAFLKNAPGDASYQQYFLYYAAQAYFHASPEAWNDWNRKNVKTLAGTQNEDGSWDGQFGPTFSTAASLLSLALNYRYLPIYER